MRAISTPAVMPAITAVKNPAPARPSEASVCGTISPLPTRSASDFATSKNEGISHAGSAPLAEAACQTKTTISSGSARNRSGLSNLFKADLRSRAGRVDFFLHPAPDVQLQLGEGWIRFEFVAVIDV